MDGSLSTEYEAAQNAILAMINEDMPVDINADRSDSVLMHAALLEQDLLGQKQELGGSTKNQKEGEKYQSFPVIQTSFSRTESIVDAPLGSRRYPLPQPTRTSGSIDPASLAVVVQPLVPRAHAVDVDRIPDLIVHSSSAFSPSTTTDASTSVLRWQEPQWNGAGSSRNRFVDALMGTTTSAIRGSGNEAGHVAFGRIGDDVDADAEGEKGDAEMAAADSLEKLADTPIAARHSMGKGFVSRSTYNKRMLSSSAKDGRHVDEIEGNDRFRQPPTASTSARSESTRLSTRIRRRPKGSYSDLTDEEEDELALQQLDHDINEDAMGESEDGDPESYSGIHRRSKISRITKGRGEGKPTKTKKATSQSKSKSTKAKARGGSGDVEAGENGASAFNPAGSSKIKGSAEGSNDTLSSKLFPCPTCGENFIRAHNLKGHERSHRNEKPYACTFPDCKKAFARPHDRKRHQMLHNGSKQFRCGYCTKSFARLDAIRRHQRSESGRTCRLASEQAAVGDTVEAPGASSSTTTADDDDRQTLPELEDQLALALAVAAHVALPADDLPVLPDEISVPTLEYFGIEHAMAEKVKEVVDREALIDAGL